MVMVVVAAVAAVAGVAGAGDAVDDAGLEVHPADPVVAGVGDVEVARGVRRYPRGAHDRGGRRLAAVAAGSCRARAGDGGAPRGSRLRHGRFSGDRGCAH